MLKSNSLTLFNVDTLFQKQFRLKTMQGWDYRQFSEMLGNKTDYTIVQGKSLSGKTTVANFMAAKLGFKLISMTKLEEELKAKLGTEEEPIEEVPLETLY